ncbi:MAG: uridine diphosphate-N-acetylglucosamine-binding protein YvcK [Clostridiaceae bacterium]
MRIWEWLRPGIKVKRWIFLALLGILLIVLSIIGLVYYRDYGLGHIAFWGIVNLIGGFIIYVSGVGGLRSIVSLINKGYLKLSLDKNNVENLIYEKRLLIQGPKIVVIGGGTGLSTMLRGLKYYTSNITAIVTVADDGGSSGDLREDLGMLAPGDIRNCILALADTEPLMEELLQYRFTDGRLKNHSFGNLFLAAMDGISDNFEDAVQKMSSVLAVTGKVLPVTLDDMKLKARFKNGSIVEGESIIPKEAVAQGTSIEKMMIIPEEAKALPDAIEAIMDADAVIIGPGSLYTSIIPNLLVKDITAALRKSNALKIYVSNIMTQPGESDGFTAADHVKAIMDHSHKDIIDYVIGNVEPLGRELRERYLKEGSTLVTFDRRELEKLGVEIIEANLVKVKKDLVRHDADYLARVLAETIMEKKLLYDKKRILEYMYLSERIRTSKTH